MNKQYSNCLLALTHSCAYFRRANEGAANQKLTEFLDEFVKLTDTFSPDKTQYISQIMPVLLDAQQRRDYVYLADLLEYEIAPLMR